MRNQNLRNLLIWLVFVNSSFNIFGFETQGQTTLSKRIDRLSEPYSYTRQEFISGTTGAMMGALLSVKFLTPLLANLLPRSPSCQGFQALSDFCKLPEKIAYIVGSSLGASVAVIYTGSLYGVVGNAPMSLLGSIVGAILGLPIGLDGAQFPGGALVLWLAGASAIPGALSTVGYNLGARIQVSNMALPSGNLAVPLFNSGVSIEVRAMSLTPTRLELVSARIRW